MKTNPNTFLLISLLIILMLRESSTIAQEFNPWEITVAPDMPYITTIDIGNKTIPFLSKVEKIWDESKSGLPYNAFTDLARFRGEWYCAFREAEIHNNHDSGRGRIIKSSDGKVWKSVALFEWDRGDIRDPKLSLTPEDQLMASTSIAFLSKKPYGRQSVTWLSSDGDNWSSAYNCNSGINTWRWSVTWHNGVGYSIAYGGKDGGGTLYTTRDGKIWETLAKNIFPGNGGSESSIAFGQDNKAYCLLRYDSRILQSDGTRTTYRSAHLGIARPPYTEWSWTDLRAGLTAIGGPKMIRLKDGRLLAGGRGPMGKTILVWIDPEKMIMKELLVLPSGGQGGSSYPGIVEHEGMIWVSYYSGHEYETVKDRSFDNAPAAIYLAKVKLAPKKELPLVAGKVEDKDGNIYNTVIIGTQVWMAENLKTTKFNDGEEIPLLTDTIRDSKTPGYCWYKNDKATYSNTYGALYNWYAVNTGKLCPTGWHVPTDDEWETLAGYLGGIRVAGDKLKETGTKHWTSPNTGATNEKGFTALPGGYCEPGGVFSSAGNAGWWWSSPVEGAPFYWYTIGNISNFYTSWAGATIRRLSVRCLKDY